MEGDAPAWQGAVLGGPHEHRHLSTSITPFLAGYMECFVFYRHVGGQEEPPAAPDCSLCSCSPARGARGDGGSRGRAPALFAFSTADLMI